MFIWFDGLSVYYFGVFYCSSTSRDTDVIDMSDSDNDDEQTTVSDEGNFFAPNDDVNAAALNVFKSEKNLNISYNNDVRIFLQTDEFVGDITTYEGEFARSILVKKSRVLEQFRQAVASKMEKKADVGYYSRAEAETMAVFPSPVKRDGKYCINVIVDGTERNIFLNELSKLGPCKMDAMLQCKGVVSNKNASGQTRHTIKLGIASMRVQSLPSDFVYSPTKSFINKYK